MGRGVGLSRLHARARAHVVGRAVRGAAGAGLRGVLARHERADVVQRFRGADPAAVGPARPGGARGRPPGGAQRLRAVHGAGRLRGAAPAVAPGAAVSVLPLGLGGHAALRGDLVGGRGDGLAGAAGVAVAGAGPRSVRGAVLGSGRGRLRRQSVAGAVPQVVPARLVSAAVPHARESAGGTQGALGVRSRGAGARAVALLERRSCCRTSSRWLIWRGAPARPMCGRCGGGHRRTGRCATARTRFCWGTVCWSPRYWTRVPTGVRCSCRGAFGTTR